MTNIEATYQWLRVNGFMGDRVKSQACTMVDCDRPVDSQDFGTEWTYLFTTRTLAWSFLANTDEAGFIAGFPSLKPNRDGLYTVRVVRPVSA